MMSRHAVNSPARLFTASLLALTDSYRDNTVEMSGHVKQTLAHVWYLIGLINPLANIYSLKMTV